MEQVAAYHHQVRPEPWVLTQMLFFESGGLWLLPLLAAVSIALSVTRRSPLPALIKERPDAAPHGAVASPARAPSAPRPRAAMRARWLSSFLRRLAASR